MCRISTQSCVHAYFFSTAIYSVIILLFLHVGFVISSGLSLFSYFFVLYSFNLALKLFYPLKSAKLYNSDYSRTIYIVMILILCIVAATPSIVAAGLSKYRISSFPPVSCELEGTYHIYIVTLPASTAIYISLIMMLFVLYKIHVVSSYISTRDQA